MRPTAATGIPRLETVPTKMPVGVRANMVWVAGVRSTTPIRPRNHHPHSPGPPTKSCRTVASGWPTPRGQGLQPS